MANVWLLPKLAQHSKRLCDKTYVQLGVVQTADPSLHCPLPPSSCYLHQAAHHASRIPLAASAVQPRCCVCHSRVPAQWLTARSCTPCPPSPSTSPASPSRCAPTSTCSRCVLRVAQHVSVGLMLQLLCTARKLANDARRLSGARSLAYFTSSLRLLNQSYFATLTQVEKMWACPARERLHACPAPAALLSCRRSARHFFNNRLTRAWAMPNA